MGLKCNLLYSLMLMRIMVRLVLFVDVDKGSSVRLFVLAYMDRG
jgi:hypothetical protein